MRRGLIEKLAHKHHEASVNGRANAAKAMVATKVYSHQPKVIFLRAEQPNLKPTSYLH